MAHGSKSARGLCAPEPIAGAGWTPEQVVTLSSGLLACDVPITKAVVDAALHNLQADPDRHKPRHKEKDDRTLQRGYFHASDDSQNAHGHLCRSIVKHVAGTFFYSDFRTTPGTRMMGNASLAASARSKNWRLSSLGSAYLSGGTRLRRSSNDAGASMIRRRKSGRSVCQGRTRNKGLGLSKYSSILVVWHLRAQSATP